MAYCTCDRPLRRRPPVPGTRVPVTSPIHSRSAKCVQWEEGTARRAAGQCPGYEPDKSVLAQYGGIDCEHCGQKEGQHS